MKKLRFLTALFAIAMLAACGDLAPTAPEGGGSDFRCGYLGSGC